MIPPCCRKLAKRATAAHMAYNSLFVIGGPAIGCFLRAAERYLLSLHCTASHWPWSASSVEAAATDPASRPLRQLRSIEGEMPTSLAIQLNGRPHERVTAFTGARKGCNAAQVWGSSSTAPFARER